jgi:asparagine synthase (glutamine-hydrolysing)
MFYSVENRSPYLDRNLLNFAYTIPPKHLISNGYQKKILRDVGEGILIDQIRLNRQKKGFNASISSVVNLKDKDVIEKIFDVKSPISEFINLGLLKKDINFDNIPNHYSKLIFSIIGTNQFLEQKF